jgi:hypothetical protein
MQRVMEPRRRWRARPSGKADHRVTIPVRPRIIPEEAKRRLRIMFVAKHALWDGGLHPDEAETAVPLVPGRKPATVVLDDGGDAPLFSLQHDAYVVGSRMLHDVREVDGVAIDPRDESVYFGLGTANFADPYLLDEEGRPRYRIDGERGTILKVSPDFKKREVFCTGIRFPVGLAFNREGDLFGTDQEGATWVPNGNPFDELLLLQGGRHYGFPPRHPRHLPDVIDEPSVFDYAPQHQSTCGLVINEPLQSGGPIFGPEHWRRDAIVTGQSRGKLYRTALVRDAVGEYVAENHLIACLSMLTVDCCLSPHGDLLVACHSGGPDWGTGPARIVTPA